MRLSLVALFALALGCTHRAPPPLEVLLAVRQPSGGVPAFPPECRRVGRIAFVAVPPLATLDVAALAARYRQVYGVEVELLPALPADAIAGALDPARRQYGANRVLTTLAGAFAPSPAEPRWIIGVTDGDLFWEQMNWRFSFSVRGGQVAIVSSARTKPGGADSAGRVMKLISRALAETYCGLERGGPKNSVLSPTLLSLDDLDAIDESVWVRGPSWL